jgi:hypothetical protein
VFDNRELRRIFGPKSDHVTGGWRKLHNKELHGLYSSHSIVKSDQGKEDEMGGACGAHGGGEGCIQHFGWEA